MWMITELDIAWLPQLNTINYLLIQLPISVTNSNTD